ncbi:NUDIX domain-containing protein [Antribacter gilvus]|uniref:NUDIX domain-containing protein n=1 Tax=Antribacter gilvus TaxID=2304675 RepID=UPI000F770D33|nr:NUDIX hydrolase [Antribacter gilvus]
MKLLERDEYYATLPRKRIAAGVLLRDDADRVVLVEPTYKPTWEIPGGVVESEEPPWAAARRELTEELRIKRGDMRVLVIDHVPQAKDGRPEGLVWIFDGGLLSTSEMRAVTRREADDEVRGAGLFPIATAKDRTSAGLGRRLEVALTAALSNSGPVLCNHGYRTTETIREPAGVAP